MLESFIALLGGLALLLFGMKLLSEGLELVAGSKMRALISKLTKNKYMGALLGLAITFIIQSSSAATIMVVGFVNAGLMQLAEAVGVVMGANLGTAATNFIFAIANSQGDSLKICAFIALISGVILFQFFKKEFFKNFGRVILALSLVFLGIEFMSESMKPLQASKSFVDIIELASNPFIGIIIGVVVTAILQSSTATTALLISCSAKGSALTLSNTVFLVYGLNIGTCITAMLSSIGTNKTAKRTAVVHLVFNISTALMFAIITLCLPYREFIEYLIPNDVKWQIFAVHCIFNLVGTLVMLPISNILIKIAYKFVPGEDPQKETLGFAFLDDRILNTPSLAVGQIMQEVKRMGTLAKKNFSTSMNMIYSNDISHIKSHIETEELLDYLNRGITEYLTKISSLDLDINAQNIIGKLYHVVNDIERIGDHSTNICDIARSVHESSIVFSEDALEDIKKVHDTVSSLIDNAYALLRENPSDIEMGRRVKAKEEFVDYSTRKLKAKHIKRLSKGGCSAVISAEFMDLLTNLERIADHANNIAFSILSEEEVLE